MGGDMWQAVVHPLPIRNLLPALSPCTPFGPWSLPPALKSNSPSNPHPPTTHTLPGTDERSLHGALDRALAHYKERPDSWRDLALCNMNTELSWGRSASDYVALYNSVAMP
jgi:hypothetical protein